MKVNRPVIGFVSSGLIFALAAGCSGQEQPVAASDWGTAVPSEVGLDAAIGGADLREQSLEFDTGFPQMVDPRNTLARAP